jgi:integrase
VQWADVDWDAGTIQIRRQVQVIQGSITISDYTKTDAGQRMLPLAPGLLARLRTHWTQQQEERTLAGASWHDHDLIVPSELGTPLGPSNIHRQYRTVLPAAGLPHIRIHDLRHTCATLLGDLTSDRIISAILGHTPGSITAKYAKVTIAQMREALDTLYQRLTAPD